MKKYLLFAPATLYLAGFFVYPLFSVLAISVTEPFLGLGNYLAFFSSTNELGILFRTFWVGAIVTVLTLLISYPIAFAAANTSRTTGILIMAMIGIGFWTSYIVRTYAWMVILGAQGPIGQAAVLAGFERPRILFTTSAAIFAMTSLLIPYMVFILYSVMKKVDLNYLKAAHSLGATPAKAFFKVYLPLTYPGIVNGVTLVFITCIGFYVTPTLVGSSNEKMIAGRIGEHLERSLDFGAASTGAAVLMLMTMLVYAIYDRLFGLQKLWDRR